MLLIGVVFFFFEFAARRNLLHREIARKLLHIISGMLGALAVYLVDDKSALLIATASLSIATLIGVRQDLFISFHEDERKSWGMFFMPLGYFFLLIFFYDNYKWIIFLAMFIESFADSFAGIFGTFFSKKYFRITSDKKSIRGSLVFVVTAFLILILFGFVKEGFNVFNETIKISINFYFIVAALIISIIAGVFEAASSKGSDNFFVPLVSAFLLKLLFDNPNSIMLIDFSIGLVFAFLVAIISYRVKFLTLNGSVATFLLAGFIFGIGGWKWSVPMLTFFILSSVLSKLRKNKNDEVEIYFEKSGVRDIWQVIANGGLSGLILILYAIQPNEFYYLIYLSILAAVCADTWATEIGTWTKTSTYNILNFKLIEQGKSGGISVKGLFGALLGSIAISISGIFWSPINFILFFSLVIFSGLFGSLIDSILGATVQAQHTCRVCAKTTEKEIHCGVQAKHQYGLSWINNDVVNLIAGISGALFIIIINYFVNF